MQQACKKLKDNPRRFLWMRFFVITAAALAFSMLFLMDAYALDPAAADYEWGIRPYDEELPDIRR